MAKRRVIYRDYRPGKGGKFTTRAAFNRSKAQGGASHIHREYVNRNTINSVDDLFDVQDDDDLIDYEFHATGDTGSEE